MSYPVYIPTRVVTVGGAVVLESAVPLTIKATVTASRPLVWDETGFRFEKSATVFTSVAGEQLEIVLPVTDVAGWKDANTGALIDVSVEGSYTHRYVTRLRFYDAAGKAVGGQYTIGPFVLPTGETPVDLDSYVPTSTVAGDTVSVPDAWGELVASAEAAAVAAAAAAGDAVDQVVTDVADPETPMGGAVRTAVEGDIADENSGIGTALRTTIAGEIEGSAYLPSTFAQSGTISGSWAFLGDSITVGSAASAVGGFASLTAFYSFQRIQMKHRAGYAGFRSDQILPYVTTSVIPSGAKTCFVLVGTNDANQNVTLPAYRGYVVQIIDALKAAGIQPVLGTVPPIAAKRALVGSYNAWLRGYASAEGIPIVNIHAALVDTATGGLASGYDSGDGIHPTLAGHIVMAQTIISELQGILVPATVPLATDSGDTTNLLLNPLFLTDANADGLGDSWGNTGTATPTYSLVTDTARWRGKAQKVAITGGTYRRIEQTISSGFSPGDTLAWGCVFAIENVGGTIYGVKFDRVDTGGAAATTVFAGALNVNVNRAVFWATWIVPPGTTSFKVRHVADCTGGGSADFFFAQSTLINLTTLGLA